MTGPAPTRTIPTRIYDLAIGGFIAVEARRIIEGGGVCGNVMHVGDPLGTVFAWLWRSDQHHCIFRLADLMAELRHHAPGAPTPPITLQDVIDGFDYAWPNDFTDQERRDFADRAKREVPRHGTNLTH